MPTKFIKKYRPKTIPTFKSKSNKKTDKVRSKKNS